MNFKLISLIFSGITLAGGATAITVIKSKNSLPKSEDTNTEIISPRSGTSSDDLSQMSEENRVETQSIGSNTGEAGSSVTSNNVISERRDSVVSASSEKSKTTEVADSRSKSLESDDATRRGEPELSQS